MASHDWRACTPMSPPDSRQEVIRYIVKPGDTLFGIAGKFGIKPETILWSNQQVLGDNPHSLRPDQELNILPVDGAYHRWSAGDGLNGVAKFFGVTPEAIINFPANQLDPGTAGRLGASEHRAGHLAGDTGRVPGVRQLERAGHSAG